MSLVIAASQLSLLSIIIASADDTDMPRKTLVSLLVSAVGSVRHELGMDIHSYREWLRATCVEEDLDVFMEVVDCLEWCAGNKGAAVH